MTMRTTPDKMHMFHGHCFGTDVPVLSNKLTNERIQACLMKFLGDIVPLVIQIWEDHSAFISIRPKLRMCIFGKIDLRSVTVNHYLFVPYIQVD